MILSDKGHVEIESSACSKGNFGSGHQHTSTFVVTDILCSQVKEEREVSGDEQIFTCPGSAWIFQDTHITLHIQYKSPINMPLTAKTTITPSAAPKLNNPDLSQAQQRTTSRFKRQARSALQWNRVKRLEAY